MANNRPGPIILDEMSKKNLMRWNFHLFSYNFNSKMKDFKNIIIKSFGQFFYEEFIFLTDSQYFKIKYLKNGKITKIKLFFDICKKLSLRFLISFLC